MGGLSRGGGRLDLLIYKLLFKQIVIERCNRGLSIRLAEASAEEIE
jgi:hypothetical protein